MRVGRQPAAAARQHEALRAVDDRDRVDLDAAEPLDAGHDLGAARAPAPARSQARVTTAGAARPRARPRASDQAWASHSSRSARVSTPTGVRRRRRPRPGSTAGRGRRRRGAASTATTGSGRHQLVGRRPSASRPSRITRSSSVRSCTQPTHLAARRSRAAARCRSAAAARSRRRPAASGATLTSAGHVAAARGHELAGGGRPRGVVEHAVLEHPVVVEHLREVRPAAVGQDHEHGLLRRQLAATLSAACSAMPPEPPIRMPSSRATRRAAGNASRSETGSSGRRSSRSNVVGQKSSPTPSIRYEWTCRSSRSSPRDRRRRSGGRASAP